MTSIANLGLEIKMAGYKGRGVFATKVFEEGDIIEVCPILTLYGQDAYEITEGTLLSNYFYDGSGDLDDEVVVLALGYGSLYNHEDDPNGTYRIDIQSGILTIRATRKIDIGDEISVDYGDDWDGEWSS